MKSLQTLEERINEIYKEKKTPKEIEELALLKNDLQALKEEHSEEEKATIELAEKYRDSLLKAGSFSPNGHEDDKGGQDTSLTFEECLEKVLKGN